MNDYGFQNRILSEAEIRDYIEKLVFDMNLELLCDFPLHDAGNILWVESILVTGITYPCTVEKKETKTGKLKTAITGFFKNLFRHKKR
jgi:hypothetical protein